MNQDDRSGFRRSFGEMNGPSHMRGQMSVVFNTLGGDGSRRDGESNRYPVELPGGITRWNYPVELPGGITRWNYPVELPGGITRWNYPVESGAFAAAFPECAETGSLAILGRTPRNSMPTSAATEPWPEEPTG